MKRILLLLMVFLVACGQQELVDVAPEVDEPQPEPAQDTIEPPREAPREAPETEPARDGVVETTVQDPVPEPEEQEPENTPDVQKVLDQYEEKTESYEFFNAPPPDNLQRHRYQVRFPKVRVEVYEENVRQPGDYFDTVYLDYANGSAEAYCLRGGILCREFDQGSAIPFDRFGIKLPHEYLDEIIHAEKSGSETLYDRRTFKLRYTLEGTEHLTWVDEWSGLPVRIQVGESKDAPRWEFRELGINTINPEDVNPPEKIPTLLERE